MLVSHLLPSRAVQMGYYAIQFHHLQAEDWAEQLQDVLLCRKEEDPACREEAQRAPLYHDFPSDVLLQEIINHQRPVKKQTTKYVGIIVNDIQKLQF